MTDACERWDEAWCWCTCLRSSSWSRRMSVPYDAVVLKSLSWSRHWCEKQMCNILDLLRSSSLQIHTGTHLFLNTLKPKDAPRVFGASLTAFGFQLTGFVSALAEIFQLPQEQVKIELQSLQDGNLNVRQRAKARNMNKWKHTKHYINNLKKSQKDESTLENVRGLQVRSGMRCALFADSLTACLLWGQRHPEFAGHCRDPIHSVNPGRGNKESFRWADSRRGHLLLCVFTSIKGFETVYTDYNVKRKMTSKPKQVNSVVNKFTAADTDNSSQALWLQGGQNASNLDIPGPNQER